MGFLSYHKEYNILNTFISTVPYYRQDNTSYSARLLVFRNYVPLIANIQSIGAVNG